MKCYAGRQLWSEIGPQVWGNVGLQTQKLIDNVTWKLVVKQICDRIRNETLATHNSLKECCE